jgi:drug/metabolite transporter (DMT)-like permease
MSRSRASRSAALALILAAASWGFGTVVSKRAVEEIPPLPLLAIQLGVSAAVLAVLTRWRRSPSGRSGVPPRLARLGLLNPGLAYGLSLIGLVSISASLSVLLWATEPLMILVLARPVLGERLGAEIVALSAVAVAGIALVVSDPVASVSLPGVALTLAGVACCAVYAVAARRWVGSAESTLEVVAAQQLHAFGVAVPVVGIAILTGATQLPVAISTLGWASAVASGVLYYAVAYWLYLFALRVLPASLAATSFYLVPVFGVGGGGLLLHEGFEPRQWAGAAVVVVALAIIGTRAGRRAAETGAAS